MLYFRETSNMVISLSPFSFSSFILSLKFELINRRCSTWPGVIGRAFKRIFFGSVSFPREIVMVRDAKT